MVQALEHTEPLGDPLLDDFRNFLHHAFMALVGAAPTKIQYDMADFAWRGPGRFRMIEALRGEGKSLITSVLVAWLVWRDYVISGGRPGINIMVVSGTKDRADMFAHFCRETFSQIPELRHLIPDDGRWSSTSFDVKGAVAQHAPTVTSRGVFGRMTGDRGDVIIFDDIEIPQNAETQGQREKLRRRAAEFLDVLKPNGHLIGLGTPQIEDTVYESIAGWGFTMRIWPAEYPPPSWVEKHGHRLAPLIAKRMDEDPSLVGKPIDPERFDEAELELKKKGGRSRYALQYMLDTSLSDEERYPLKIRDLVVMDLDPRQAPTHPIWSGAREHAITDLPVFGQGGQLFQGAVKIKDPEYAPYDFKIMALDPSGRGKDETGLAVVGALGGFNYLLRSRGLIGGYDEGAMQAILAEVKRFEPNVIVFEDNFGDGMFGALLTRSLREAGLRVGVEPVKHHTQKELRIIDAMEPVMNQHRLVVDTQVIRDDRPREGDLGETYRLFHQMTRLTAVRGALIHDDRLEAVAIAVRHLTDRMHLDQAEFLSQRRAEKERRAWDKWWEDVIDDQPQEPRRRWGANRAHGVY